MIKNIIVYICKIKNVFQVITNPYYMIFNRYQIYFTVPLEAEEVCHVHMLPKHDTNLSNCAVGSFVDNSVV